MELQNPFYGIHIGRATALSGEIRRLGAIAFGRPLCTVTDYAQLCVGRLVIGRPTPLPLFIITDPLGIRVERLGHGNGVLGGLVGICREVASPQPTGTAGKREYIESFGIYRPQVAFSDGGLDGQIGLSQRESFCFKCLCVQKTIEWEWGAESLEMSVLKTDISRYDPRVIERPFHLRTVTRLLGRFPVVGLLGARQVGKTTLAAAIARNSKVDVTHFDLEDPAAVARLADPVLALGGLRGLVILDEVQNRPELFPSLRVLADRRPVRARFLVLGSASPQLLRQSSESLAGRIAYHFLPGLSLAEVTDKQWNRLWLRGGFPRAFLVRSEAECFEWLEQFLRTFLERELPQFGISAGSQAMRRFWSMLAHGHGQVWNASEIGRSMGLSDTTVRSYLDKMADAYVMRELQPWHENLGKRQVKAPKIYVRDTGLLHALLDIRTERQLEMHSKVGASWEGFVIDQVIQALDAAPHECFFWRTHAGAELDLLVVRGARRIGVEVKRTTAPALTPSIRSAMTDLKLSQLYLVHAGEVTFPLAKKVQAVAFADLLKEVGKLK